MKALFCYILFFCLTSVIHASENTLGLDSVSKLKTLFTTSTERKQLDDLRNSGKFDKHFAHSTVSFLEKPLTVNMQGLVIRSTKAPIVFVNDSNTLKSNSINNQIIVNNKSINASTASVPLRIKQKSIHLKPGQAWNESDRKTRENYQIKDRKKIPVGPSTIPLSKILE